MKKNTAVIIPNWNGLPFVLDCLQALTQQSFQHDIIVVDNGSKDESVVRIREQFADVHIIELAHNTGFTGGVNAGLRYALEKDYAYAALLNNDATPTNNWLSELVNTMESNPMYGIVTCKLLHTDGTHFDSTGDFYSSRGIAFPRDRNQKDAGQRDKSEEVFGATGGASLYRIAMLREIGLFDDYFFAYFEDVDVSFRARLAGWKVMYQPKAICYHAISATSSKLGSFSRYHSVKNLPILYLKNMPGLLFWKYLPLFMYQMLRQLAASTIKGVLGVHLKALFVMCAHIPSALRDRRRIQKNRKVQPKDIDSLLWHGVLPRIPARSE